jgi:hypothetical protein
MKKLLFLLIFLLSAGINAQTPLTPPPMEIPTFTTKTISLYPNPASNIMTIENSGIEKISKLAIYDISGKRIYALNNNSINSISIDVSHFAKGMYLIELSSEQFQNH